jgi:hypothetical protein
MRDMGTHLCALPTGSTARVDWCASCAGTRNRSRAPRRSFGGYSSATAASLTAARESCEPAGQIAARELDVIRIESALRRAEELTEDVAGAIEAAA